MRYGAMNFPIKPLAEEIEKIARLGFDYLELTMDPPQAHHSLLGDNVRAITGRLRDAGLGLVCHLPTFVSTADLSPALREASCQEMFASLRVAAELGAAKTVLHPSMAFGMGSFVPEQLKPHFFDFLAAMTVQADQLGITLCLENMMPHNQLGVSPTDFTEIAATFPELSFTFDSGHAHLGKDGKSRGKQLLNQFGTRLRHVHLSDNLGKRDDHLPLGSGNIDFAGLAIALAEIGYDETITFEIFTADHQDLVRSRKHFQDLIR